MHERTGFCKVSKSGEIMKSDYKNILLTGATGYIGGRLLRRLEDSGAYKLRCMARKPEYLKSRVSPGTEVIGGDVLKPESLAEALEGIDLAYYLIHSMGSSGSFEELDREGAKNFAAAASQAGVKRIVYLGGLGDPDTELSDHLKSRHETGDMLRSTDVQVIEFRSSIVIGAGSLSFEMIRSLVEKLPVMITPSWVYVKTQPIAVSDLLKYLFSAIDLDVEGNRVFEVASPDVVSYSDLMKEYASQRGLKRYIIPVPVLTPKLSSLWLGLVTPLYARVGRKLIDSLRYPTVVQDSSAKEYFDIKPMSVSAAIREALSEEEKEFYESKWSYSLSSGDTLESWGGVRFGSRLLDSRIEEVNVPKEKAFTPIKRIGGKNGWYYGNWLWRLRAYIDLLFGGVGIRRGRRHPEEIAIGDVIDWWRVEDYVENRYLMLYAEMKVPGRAWLEFKVEEKEGKTVIQQIASFDPLGLTGILYWYILYPVHAVIFSRMLRNIAREAVKDS